MNKHKNNITPTPNPLKEAFSDNANFSDVAKSPLGDLGVGFGNNKSRI